PLLFRLDLQDGEERLLWNLYATNLLHALLARLLLLEQLPLARHVAAVALRQHVLAQRLHVLARDDIASDRSLHRDVEHLPRDEAAHARDQIPATVSGILAMDDERERVHLVA